MSFLGTVYATDEEIARAASADFDELLPDEGLRAYGEDGGFAGSNWAGRWTLTSARVDFSIRNITAGMLCKLTVDPDARPASWLAERSIWLAVGETPTGNSLVLRPIRSTSFGGEPPAPDAGLSDVTFEVRTFYPLIEDASFELNRDLGIDPADPGRTPSDLRDARDLNRACVYQVLYDAYMAQSRNKGDIFWAKAEDIWPDLDRIMSRLRVRWTDNDQETAPYFGARAER